MNNSQFLLFSKSVGTFCPSMSSLNEDSHRLGKYIETEATIRKPYVSGQMQKIIRLTKKLNRFSFLSLETIFPASKKIINKEQHSRLQNDSFFSFSKVDTGYTDYKDIYKNKTVYIDFQIAQDLCVTSGVYYATCKAVTYKLEKDRPVSLIPPYETDNMGVNPEVLTKKGYTYTLEISSDGKYSYEFVTYILTLTSANGDNDYNPHCFCNGPCCLNGELVKVSNIEEFMNNLKWRYIY